MRDIPLETPQGLRTSWAEGAGALCVAPWHGTRCRWLMGSGLNHTNFAFYAEGRRFESCRARLPYRQWMFGLPAGSSGGLQPPVRFNSRAGPHNHTCAAAADRRRTAGGLRGPEDPRRYRQALGRVRSGADLHALSQGREVHRIRCSQTKWRGATDFRAGRIDQILQKRLNQVLRLVYQPKLPAHGFALGRSNDQEGQPQFIEPMLS
jgi:hypothetical protein